MPSPGTCASSNDCAPGLHALSAISCAVVVAAVGYQTTICSGRPVCESCSVEDWKPMGVLIGKGKRRQASPQQCAENCFQSLFFLEWVRVMPGWTQVLCDR
ncbi:hypothetical protein WR25_01480 [Diploscapter pachys]|uniref:Uncharacterized protein n=1 Tax=Diploscapter pachys TaxID=2018661 RepID=A0A2A2K9B3_9BILA|nr:hypothetical protein WR25_01480 [Diploscapter pachys]